MKNKILDKIHIGLLIFVVTVILSFVGIVTFFPSLLDKSDGKKLEDAKWQECNDVAWKLCNLDGRNEMHEYLLNYTDHGSSNDTPILMKFEELIFNNCYLKVAELCEQASFDGGENDN